MEGTVFEHKDYKAYLSGWLEKQPQGGRGLKTRMAEAIHCEKAYLSRVLNGDAHLSLEQADLLNQYLGHTAEEAEYFLLLVQLARAGTSSLKSHFTRRMSTILEGRLNIKDRLGIKDTLSREDQSTYYSAWYYIAIHMLLGIPGFQTKEELSRHLGLSLKQVGEVLEFLTGLKLAQVDSRGRYSIGSTRIHLERDSPLISKHHTNWRMQAIRSFERSVFDDLHYSVIAGISDQDASVIKEMMVKFIADVMKVVHASKDQGVHCFALDFFRV